MRLFSRIGVAIVSLSFAGHAVLEAAKPSVILRWDPDKPGQKSAAIWLGYLTARVVFHEKHRLPMPASGGEIIPTFEEELDARRTASQIYRELKENDSKLKDAYWEVLSEVDRRGFMGGYVWTFLRRKQWPATARPSNLAAFDSWRRQALPKHTPLTYGWLEAGKP
jgi:hypothetical protein